MNGEFKVRSERTKITGDCAAIDARVAAKLREQQDLDLRTHEQALLDAYQRGLAVGETLRWYKLGFAFLMGAFLGILIAAGIHAASH